MGRYLPKVYLPRAFLAVLAIATGLALGAPQTRADDNWTGLRKEFFADRPIVDGAKSVVIDAPEKAEDSAVVPVSIYISADVAATVKSMHVFIDNNPMPLVGKFEFGSAAGPGARAISTRVRFDSFSFLRAVVETTDGQLLMGEKFVQAAGGCSGTALKDVADAMEHVGEMHLKKVEAQKFASTQQSALVMREAQVMLRHPNYSGMQMDQATGTFIPAKYVREVDVKRGNDLIFRLEAGISLSTNPNIRFTYGSLGEEELVATAKDSDGLEFNAVAPAGGS